MRRFKCSHNLYFEHKLETHFQHFTPEHCSFLTPKNVTALLLHDVYIGVGMLRFGPSLEKLFSGVSDYYEGHQISSDNDCIKQNLFFTDMFQ